MISSITMLPNCTPAAISPGLQVEPPAAERLSQRIHSIEKTIIKKYPNLS